MSYFLSCVFGHTLVCMSPTSFIKRPELWLMAMEKYQAITACAPTFAYQLLAKRLRSSGNTYDLSSVLCVDIAAEPVTRAALRDAVSVGFNPAAIQVSYGMAEAVVWAASAVNPCYDAATGLVSVGDTEVGRLLGSIAIVADPTTHTVVADGVEGHVYISNPGVSPGYYGRPNLNEKVFGLALEGTDPTLRWYDTRDLGYIKGGQLFVSGRSSDVIIVAGRNIWPTDIERQAESLLSKVGMQ